jgi:hypothetical protein
MPPRTVVLGSYCYWGHRNLVLNGYRNKESWYLTATVTRKAGTERLQEQGKLVLNGYRNKESWYLTATGTRKAGN